MRNKLRLIVCLHLFFFSFYGLAQKESAQSLGSIIELLQERYGVQFNYASALLDNVSITPPAASLTLKESIAYLSERIKLDFVFLSDKIVSIKKRNILICGFLKDKDSGEVLPYVTIQNDSNGTISNEEGFFELELKGDSGLITISHTGHKTIIREASLFDTGKCNIIHLVQSQEQLAEVVLQSYLIRGIDKLNDGSFNIDFNKFSLLPGLVDDDVLQSVQALPGIQSIDETVSNINIRGGTNDQNLISWDGIKMYQSGHFFGLISMYNPDITQKVELRKNGSSASETDGVSGTVAMSTQEFINPRVKGRLGINLIDANGYVDTPLGKKASIQVAVRKSISDLVETPTYTEYFSRIKQDTELERNTQIVTNSNIEFDFYDTSLRLLFQPSANDRLRVNIIHTANEVVFNENAEVSENEEIRESNLDQQSIAGGIDYGKDWTRSFTTELSIYETYYKLKSINADILENQRFLQENEVSETSAKLKASYQVTPQFNWINGYHFIETKVTNLDDVDNPLFISLVGEVLRTHAFFSEVGLSSTNRNTNLNVGIRLNQLNEFNKQLWEPRLSFNHGFWESFNLEILGEFKHQSTTQVINFQNDFLGIEKRRWQLSNDESIPVVTSRQASIGLSFTKRGWLINAVAYYKDVNGITTQSQGFQDRYEFVRTSGSYNAKGLDLLLRKQHRNNNIWVSYSYLNSDYFFDQLPETRFPNNFDITHALTVGSDYTINRLLLAAGLNWRTGRPLTMPMPNNEVVDGSINFDGANGNRLDDYFRLDVSAKYNFKWRENKKVQIGLAVWNILDKNNTINTFYRTDGLGQAQEFEQSSLGITPNASIRLIFN